MRLWSESEKEYLLENHGKVPFRSIAKVLGRTIKAVEAKSHRMGLLVKSGKGVTSPSGTERILPSGERQIKSQFGSCWVSVARYESELKLGRSLRKEEKAMFVQGELKIYMRRMSLVKTCRFCGRCFETRPRNEKTAKTCPKCYSDNFHLVGCKFSLAYLFQAFELLHEGKNKAEISRLMGVSHKTISRQLLKYKFILKDSHYVEAPMANRTGTNKKNVVAVNC